MTAAAGPPHRHDPRRWFALPVILSATFMAMFDFFVVNVAAPSFQHDLGAGQAELELIVGGYAFTYASGMVTGGRLGDLFGHRRIFVIGMLAFTIASLLCGISADPMELVGARLLQGIAGAAMVPQVLALMTSTFPPAERPRAFAWFGVVIGLASIAGQILGGVLLAVNLFGWGWRTIFLINVPVGLLAALLALRLLPRARTFARPRLDFVGALGLPVGLALVLVPLVLGRDIGWPLWTWLSIAASAPVLLGVVGYELWLGRRGGEPVMDLALLRSRAYTGGLVIGSAALFFFGTFMFVLTLLLQSGFGLSPLAAGLTFGPLGIAFAATSMAARPLSARYGWRTIALGAASSSTGLAVLLVTLLSGGPGLPIAALLPGMVLIGVGNAFMLPTLVSTALHDVPSHRAGGAAGMITTAQQFASAIGVAVLGSVFFATLGDRTGREPYVTSTALVLVILLGAALLALAATRLLRPVPEGRRRAAHARRVGGHGIVEAVETVEVVETAGVRGETAA
jgi:EmrB/QacA subfamily drug resistance transporter